MSDKIFLEIVSYREDGKLVENETDKELSVDEAVKVVQECWDDMPAGYYSWKLEKVIFKDRTNGL